jgi:hypothetical protein
MHHLDKLGFDRPHKMAFMDFALFSLGFFPVASVGGVVGDV